MATGKKSFVLYADQRSVFDKLPNEKAGELIKHIFSYINDEDPEIKDDLLLEIAFDPIKRQLKRDLENWEGIRQARSEAGKLGGRPKKQEEAKKANASFEKQTKAKKAVTVNVNDNVNDNVTDTDICNTKESKKDLNSETFEFFWKLYPKKKAKPKAFEYWKKLKINEELLRNIIGSLQSQMSSEDWQKDGGKFIPYPQKWINEQRWLDEEVPSVEFKKPFNFNF